MLCIIILKKCCVILLTDIGFIANSTIVSLTNLKDWYKGKVNRSLPSKYNTISKQKWTHYFGAVLAESNIQFPSFKY
jgi:capsular polysaccharide biosynthesis protein